MTEQVRSRLAVYSLVAAIALLTAITLYQAQVIRNQRAIIRELFKALYVTGGSNQS